MKGGMSKGAARTGALAPGRVIVGDRRFSGCIQDLTPNGYGWIVPLEAVPHPAAKKRNGRIYFEQRDVEASQSFEVGSNVDFVLYADVRGLGATDVQLAAEDPADAFAQDTNADLPLPAGWEKIWSDEHDQFYYWHQVSKESSWERPGGDEQQAAEETHDPSLPANWEKHYDDENADWYYWNHVTKESSWERPCTAERSSQREVEDKPVASKTISTDDAQTRVHGRVTSWQTIYGWMVPVGHVGVAMKSLIDNHGGKIFLNWRDAPGIDIKVGTELDFEVYVDNDKGLCAADIRPYMAKNDASGMKKGFKGGKKGAKGKGKGEQDPLASLESQWAKQDKKLGVTSTPAKKRTADEMEADEEELPSIDGPLMPGWEQHWSEEHNCYYYWHKSTKQSAWERPSMPMESNDNSSSKFPGSAKSTPKTATPMTPLQSGAGGCGITPITAIPTKTNHVPRQPAFAPSQKQTGHGNRPILPVWQKQSGKRGRY